MKYLLTAMILAPAFAFAGFNLKKLPTEAERRKPAATSLPVVQEEITCNIAALFALAKGNDESDVLAGSITVKGSSKDLMTSMTTVGKFDYVMTLASDYYVDGMYQVDVMVMNTGEKPNIKTAITTDTFVLKYDGPRNAFTPEGSKSKLTVLMDGSLQSAPARWTATRKVAQFLKDNPQLNPSGLSMDRRSFMMAGAIDKVAKEGLNKKVFTEGELMAIGPVFDCGRAR